MKLMSTRRLLVLLVCITLIGCAEERLTTLKPGVSFKVYSVIPTATETSLSIVDEASGKTLILATPAILTEDDVQFVCLENDKDLGESLQGTLTVAGGEKLRAATTSPAGMIAIVVDDKLISTPNANATVSRNFRVTGAFEPGELQSWIQPAD